MNYTTIIFDLDGTILNTIVDLADSMNYVLRQLGYPEHSVEDICNFVGNGVDRLVKLSLPEGASVEEFDKCRSMFGEYYKQHSADKTCPYDGIPQLLAQLKESGCKLAVVSNKPDFAVGPLCENYFSGMFDIAVGEREGIRRKPFPDSVNEVINKLGSEKDKTLYVGDSDVDVETAKNAGIDCVAVSWGFRGRDFLEKHGARVIADTSDELAGYIYGK